MRGPPRSFTHSKVMAWVALDRAIEAVERHGLAGEVDRWRTVRREIHETVCAHGYHAGRAAFTQEFGSDRLDASLLMMPLVGFLPIDDERVAGTVEAIRKELTHEGLVHRYHPRRSADVDGLPPGEGTFLPCSFWLVDCLCLANRHDEARVLFEQLLALRTPLGLLSEEYDSHARRLVGNFPQAFSHVALVNSAHNLARGGAAAKRR
jgi:GH15 family glucan-1,4-alpha-glucosidase